MTTKTEISLCGAVDLLAAIFGEDCNQLRFRYGLPLTCPICLGCGEKLSYATKSGYCRQCWNRLRHIKVVCSSCGDIFDITQAVLIERSKRHKIEEIFCSRSCWGKYVARHYGFLAHPENIAKGVNPRKWDYSKIFELRDRTGWGATRIGRALGIPMPTVDTILCRRKKEVESGK